MDRTVGVRFTGNAADLDATMARSAVVAQDTGKKIGDHITVGASRAGGALHHLSNALATWNLPFTGSLDKMAGHLDTATTHAAKTKSALSDMGKIALVTATGGLVAAAHEAEKMGESFQTAQAKIAGTMGVSMKAAANIANAFTGIHGTFSAAEAAGDFGAVAGQLKATEGHALSTAQALKVMATATDLADAQQIDLGSATNGLAAVMQTYHLHVSQASRATDVLFNVSRALNMPVDQVGKSILTLHARLGALAPSLGDTAGLMTELGRLGVGSSQRGLLAVNTSMQTLSSGSKKVDSVLSALNVHLYNSQGQYVGLKGTIAQLGPALGHLDDQQRNFAEHTLFGSKGVGIMNQVLRAGVPAFTAASQAATKQGTTAAAAAQQATTLKQRMETLQASVTNVGTKIGLWLIPKLIALGQAISNGIGWIEKHRAAAIALAGVITSVLGVAIGVYMVNKIASMVNSFKTAGAALSEFKGWLGQLAGKFTGTGEAAQGMATATETAATEASGAVSGATAKIEADSEAIDTSLASVSASFEGVGTAAAGAAGGVGAEMAAMAAEVETADTAIEEANAAAGASFTALLGPLGALAAGAAGTAALINAIPVNAAPAGWNGRGGRFGVPLPGSGGGSGNVGTLAAPSGAAANSQLLNVGANSNATGVGDALAKAQAIMAHAARGEHSAAARTKAVNAALAALQAGKAVKGSGGSGGGSGGGTGATPRTNGLKALQSYTPVSFAVAALTQLGITPTPQNVLDFTAWENAEGGNWHNQARYNPLNTKMAERGSTTPPGFASPGIRAYPTWAVGLKGTTDTLRNYGGILAALRSGASPSAFSSAVASSPWGTGAVGAAGDRVSQQQIESIVNQLGGTGINVRQSAPKSPRFGVPAGVVAGLNLAQQLVGAPYNNGSGHSAAFDESVAAIRKFGTDCSGLVSVILKKIEGNTPGHISSAQTTQGLPTAGGLSTGQGRYVTVWDRHTGPVGDEHTIIDILGKWFESGGNKAISPNPDHVVQLTAQQAAREMAQGAPFQAFHPTQFNAPVANGLTGTVGGTSTSGSGTTPNIQQNIQQIIQQVIAGLSKSATSLITTWTTAQQNASVKSLESALGVTTSGGTGAHLSAAVKALQPAVGANGPTNAQLNYVLTPLLQQAMAGTAVFHAQLVGTLSKVHGAALGKLDALLGEKHKASLTTLVGELIGLHRGAMAHAVSVLGKSHDKRLRTVAGELSAGPQASVSEKNYNALIANLRASHDKALTALIPKLVAAHQQMLLALDQELWAKAESAYARGLSLQATELKDQTSIAATMAANVVQAMKDAAQQMTDQMAAAASFVKDSATQMSDALQATAKAIEDQTQAMADASSAQVSGIQDQSQTVTDTLAERGLYGLNLVAQQQQVALDQMKTGYDQQIGQAQAAIDTAQANTDNASAAAQAYMDAIQTQQDVLTGAAQQNLDAVAAAQNASVGAAQRNLDNVTKSTDAAVQQAQNAVEAASTGTKAQQDAAAAALEQAQATQNMQVAQAQGALSAAQNAANQAVQQAQGALDSASGQAAVAEAAAQAAVDNANGNASVLIAQAKQTLQTVTDQANVAEAQQQAIVAKIAAEAQTQYAGSGLVINIEGINPTDAAAIASEVGWQLRTILPA